jgi:hypothetical protein
MRTKTERDVK